VDQFAVNSVSPCSIAWLINNDDWDHLEKLIHYNCSILGGYFNIFVPVNDEYFITEEYKQLIRVFDPDYIVLAPHTPLSKISLLNDIGYPFNILTLEQFQSEGIVPDDPFSYAYREYKGLPNLLDFLTDYILNKLTLVAVADPAYQDASRLALIACGDLQRRIY